MNVLNFVKSLIPNDPLGRAGLVLEVVSLVIGLLKGGIENEQMDDVISEKVKEEVSKALAENKES